MAEIRKPTAEEAVFFAQCLEVGGNAEDVLRAMDPEMDVAVVPETARRWAQHQAVRAARFSYREWLKKTFDQKLDETLDYAYIGMMTWVRTQIPGELETAKLAKFTAFVERLEKRKAGAAGRSESDLFFERAMANWKALKPEAVQ